MFRTGDLFVKDELGYLYFKDRMGDSFRWKGENVSTNELKLNQFASYCTNIQVEYVISNLTPKKNDVVVFGVKIPFSDGQAGMAVIADDSKTLDLPTLTEGIKKSLPSYARPLFLRIVEEIEQTGTHKMKKTDFQKDAYDISKCSSNIYFLLNGKYTPLTTELYDEIVSGKRNL
ncbi:Long-chain fatty acid transport protein 1 [Orchesella cincta]|uniref:Long-chain fatty acid transport protein 1 n=1 Tax=Orchesella cincta TaxID=48709 RepID=A0A1D2M9N2_ORCCI|nr:Long-chain fatty acid transport protein 1 [Orchesella cincta]